MLCDEKEISVLNILIESKDEEIIKLRKENAKLRTEVYKWRMKLCDAQTRIRKLNWSLTKTLEAGNETD